MFHVLSSLRSRLILLVLTVAIPLLVLLLYNAVERRRLEGKKAEESALRVAQEASAYDDEIIKGAEQLLVGLAELQSVREHEAASCARLFAKLLKDRPFYSNLAAVKPNGDIFCSAVPLPGPVNLTDRPYFQRVLETREFTLSEYLIGRITGKSNLILAYPAVNDSGVVKAAVLAALDLSWLSLLSARSKLPPGAVMTITDHNGTVLARYPDGENWIGKAFPDAPIFTAMRSSQGDGILEAAGLDGIPRLYGFTRLQGLPRRAEVHVTVGIPTAVVYAEANRMLIRNLTVLGLVTLVALIGVWIISQRSILRPVNFLVKASERIASGELSARTGLPYSHGELDRLARSFDQMAESLQIREAIARQAEEILRGAETRYRTLFQQSPDGILMIDPETMLSIDFNPTAHRQLGYTREEFAQLRISDYEVIEKPEETKAHAEKILRAGRNDFETKHRTKQGEIRNVLVTVQVIELAGHRVFHSIFRDITDLKHQQEKIAILAEIDKAITSTLEPKVVLTLLLEKIETLLPYSAAAVLLLNKVTGELEPEAVWNISEHKWKAQITRIRSGGFLGNRILETRTPLAIANLHTDPRPADPEFLRTEGLVSYIGIPLIAKDQSLGILSIYTKEEHEFTQEEVEFLTVLAGQAAIAIHNAELYEETTKLASDLSRSNRVKDDFLSVMSHELRTPLNVVMGYAAMMKDGMLGDLNPKQDDALGKILGRANDQLAMISNILFATAIDTAKIPVDHQVVILADLFNDLESAYHAQATGPNLTLNWDCPPDLPILETDRAKLKQILQNLIDNAIKFTEKGKISISARHDPAAKTVEFCVADTGVGIYQDMIPAIFEKFRQVDSSETRPYGGVGMGLYIAKKFTEMLGGKIEVESEVGKGSTFTITLPLNPVSRLSMDRT